jgi:ribosomal protein L21E
MAVTMLTHQMIAREAAAMLDEEMPFSTRVNRGREEEFVNAVSGYKKGDTVSIKVPPTSTVYDGATFAGGGSIDTYTETSVSLTLDTQKHTGLTFTAKERTLEISEFKERVLLPKVRSLAATVEADLILRAQKLCPNTVGTAGTTPTTAKTFGAARQLMQEYLAPPGDRTLLISTEANLEMVDASKALFNPAPSIAKMYSEGQLMGMFQGAATFETPNLQAYGNGADIAITVNGANQTGSSLTIAGNTALVKGQVFTLPGCYAVHPLTGAATTRLQQFVVTADSSSTTVSIFPPINTSFPNKTVSASPTDGGSLTFVGSASTTYKRSFMFHKDAFTVAFAPLPVLAGCEGYTASMNGMSVRVQTGGDFTNDTESTRIDVLYGIAAVRGLHACNILQ